MTFNPEGRKPPLPVQLVVEADQEVESLRLVAVDDWTIPEPPQTTRLENGESGWIAHFRGWDILKHLRPGREGDARFEGRFSDGSVFSAGGALTWKPAE